MSRIGRKPIAVPEAVTVEVAPGRVEVKGPKGDLTQTMSLEREGQALQGEFLRSANIVNTMIAQLGSGVIWSWRSQPDCRSVAHGTAVLIMEEASAP